jgi:hypothetical protein
MKRSIKTPILPETTQKCLDYLCAKLEKQPVLDEPGISDHPLVITLLKGMTDMIAVNVKNIVAGGTPEQFIEELLRDLKEWTNNKGYCHDCQGIISCEDFSDKDGWWSCESCGSHEITEDPDGNNSGSQAYMYCISCGTKRFKVADKEFTCPACVRDEKEEGDGDSLEPESDGED